MTTTPIPVTVIGFGNSAHTFHLPFVQALPQFDLYSIQQRPGCPGPQASEEYPNVHIHDSIDEVFEGEKRLPVGGLAVISITNSLHVSTAMKALENGCHVLCEKPLALSSEEAKSLQATAEKNGVVCYTYQNRRFDSDFLTLQSVLPETIFKNKPSSLSIAGYAQANQTIGTPLYFESHFDRFRPLSKGGWREEVKPVEGGGMLWDLGSHLVDQAVSLFGPPKSILAILRNTRGQQSPDLDDDFEVHLFYPSAGPLSGDSPAAGTTPAGLHCRLSASVTAPFTSEEMLRFKVYGSRGSFLSYGLDAQEGQLKAIKAPADVLADGFGRTDEGATLTLLAGHDKMRDFSTHPVQDKSKALPLEAGKIPQLQGRYKALYKNLADTIQAANALPVEEIAQRNHAIKLSQGVLVDQVAIAIRTLELARLSAEQGKQLDFAF